MTTTAPSILLTPAEAATALAIGRSLLYELIAGGTIASVKIGRSRRIRRADLEAYVARLGS